MLSSRCVRECGAVMRRLRRLRRPGLPLIKSQFIVNLLGSFNSFSYLCTEITIYW